MVSTCFYLCEVPRVVKFTDIETRMVVPKGSEKGGVESYIELYNEYTVSV